MRSILALLAAVVMIGSAAAWDISEELSYTYTKSGYEQAGSGILDQIQDVTSGAYAKEPNVGFGDGWDAEAWMQVDNTLLGASIDRTNTNPEYSCEENDFYVQLTQGGSATLTTAAKNTMTDDPEITGEATAYQNLWVGGEFSKAYADFDSRAIVGFSDVPGDAPAETAPNHFVVTDVTTAEATVDSNAHGSGYFNEANLGVQVDADISQNYVGSGWAEPTYSGGITMWANFDGACDPHCSNPIETTVSGTAWTGLFPPDDQLLPSGGSGENEYWGENWMTNPQADPGYVGGDWTTNDDWSSIFN